MQNLYNNVISTMVNNIVDNVKLTSSTETQNLLDAKSSSGSTLFMVIVLVAIIVAIYFIAPIVSKMLVI